MTNRIRSRIIIIVSNDKNAVIHNFLKFENFRFSLKQKNQIRRNKIFAFIILMRFAKFQLFSLIRHRRLKKKILEKVKSRSYCTNRKICFFFQQSILKRFFIKQFITSQNFFINSLISLKARKCTTR